MFLAALFSSWGTVSAQETCDVNKCSKQLVMCSLVGTVMQGSDKGSCHSCDPVRERLVNSGRCPCCEQCKMCLGDRFDECCECFGMCSFEQIEDNPPIDEPQISVLHFQTNDVEVERFREHTDIYIDKLFNVKFDVYHVTRDQIVTDSSDTRPRRAFWEMCMPYSECATNCQSMGAGHTRWFHLKSDGTGCCECLDPKHKHLNHDNARPMCKFCSGSVPEL